MDMWPLKEPHSQQVDSCPQSCLKNQAVQVFSSKPLTRFCTQSTCFLCLIKIPAINVCSIINV
jgi:hypothetical protein